MPTERRRAEAFDRPVAAVLTPKVTKKTKHNKQGSAQSSEQGISYSQGKMPAKSDVLVDVVPATLSRIDTSVIPLPSHLATFPRLQEAALTRSGEALSHCKEIGIGLLGEISLKLSQIKGTDDAIKHTETIQGLMRTRNPKIILGIVGSTGHGKSSLINALLDEQRLIPTNCVRACTAAVTEISWNDSDDPERRYRAEIEFISAEEWLSELEILFQDLTMSTGEALAEKVDVDAEVAWAKVKAVYPNINRNKLAVMDVKALVNDAAICKYLGSIQTVNGGEAKLFYKNVMKYIDNLQKEPGVEDAEGHNKENAGQLTMQLWPLVKVVRIFTKADALSTGTVIVDLPGVEDSNAARAAVAAKYLEKCSGIWVVAQITRAVDDKAAHKLLGQSFKQQLNYDGNYLGLTFVCTKTDDITLAEAADVLGLGRELDVLNRKGEAVQHWEDHGEQQNATDQSRSNALSSYISELDNQLSQWEKLEGSHRKGETVTASQVRSRKQKATARTFRRGKRIKTDGPEDDNGLSSYVSASEFWDGLNNDTPKVPDDDPLQVDQIRSIIDQLRAKKHVACEEKEKLDEKIYDELDQAEELSDDYANEHFELLSLCIRKRNEYSRETMRTQFAQGLRELDHDNSQRDNQDDYDPDANFRDYDKAAQALSVFCVSSKAYQGLSGRSSKRSRKVEGFSCREDTEVPQLIAHAKNFAEKARSRNNMSFLNGLLQVLNSPYVWCSIQRNGTIFSDTEKETEVAHIRASILKLTEDMRACSKTFTIRYRQIITNHLFAHLDIAVMAATRRAPATISRWPKRCREDQGLYCNSYRLACRRRGVYSGTAGWRDFNEELVDPLKRCLAQAWEVSFQQQIPQALSEFTRASEKLLYMFHCNMKSRIQKKANFMIMSALESQLGTRINSTRHIIDAVGCEITDTQREASRKFNSSVKARLETTYSTCANEAGPGCFKRIQAYMSNEIESNASQILNAAATTVKEDLESLCKFLYHGLEKSITEMVYVMSNDYFNVINIEVFDEDTKKALGELLDFLKQADESFQPPPDDRDGGLFVDPAAAPV